ncbi:hypothetical protein N4G70_35955 [Streptomyces sp. ASQP_92]|uniref:hypothetical protein n=1 Tax=Streptomyces sp. ASQP_92 TaxID=2979116 RepID=UPI0021C2058D|nr:hypothetical protein [Streptomyces sp. ASQP_92]MCT9094196.1 hypothetical protein [Streptomyces sp. ASQP_92]
MSETTPNAKGPAKVQMSPEQMASRGLTPTPEATAPQEPTLVPADQVKPEDIATLSIEYRDGQPVVVVSDGKYVPSELPVVDRAGEAYAARFAWVNGVAVLHTPDPESAPAGSPVSAPAGSFVSLGTTDLTATTSMEQTISH